MAVPGRPARGVAQTESSSPCAHLQPSIFVHHSNPTTCIMSAPSGIKVADNLKSAFASARSDGSNTRALVFIIESGRLFCSNPASSFGLVETLGATILPPPLPRPDPDSFS